MTPEQLEAIRERDAWYGPEIPLADRGSVSDRRWLLRHIEQLEERLAYTIDGYDRVVRIDANLLAHQQARALEWRSVADADERVGIGVYRRQMRRTMDQRDTLREQLAAKPPRFCEQCGDATGDDHTVLRILEKLRKERAENERLRKQLEELEAHIAEEQDIASRCEAICGECTGRCGIPDDERDRQTIADYIQRIAAEGRE